VRPLALTNRPRFMDHTSLPTFARHLITEMLFYDAEYGALGNVSLIDADQTSAQERYVGSFLPEEGQFIVEEATAWEEDYTPEEDEEIGYALATNTRTYGLYDTPEDAADALLELAAEFDLLPSLTLLFEDDIL